MSPRSSTRETDPHEPGWGIVPVGATSLVRELPIVLGGIGLFSSVVAFAHYWAGPVSARAEISLSPAALPKYALFSLLRIAGAYTLSFAFTLVYGYIAAYNRKAERIMLPLLDTLQSIPVLSFLPGVMISLVALFPSRRLGVELGSILLIFTGQVWNMTFSFYSSLKTIPAEMREAAQAYRLSWWQRFWQLELPQAAIGLIWNSMMSVAGGWFFLMACEMFVLGNRDFRLPGLGSYLQTAANAGDVTAIIWGLVAMISVIVLLDQLVWRPVIAWADKFKIEQVESGSAPSSLVLSVLQRSRSIAYLNRKTVEPLNERLTRAFINRNLSGDAIKHRPEWVKWVLRLLAVAVLAVIAYGIVKAGSVVAELTSQEIVSVFYGAGA